MAQVRFERIPDDSGPEVSGASLFRPVQHERYSSLWLVHLNFGCKFEFDKF